MIKEAIYTSAGFICSTFFLKNNRFIHQPGLSTELDKLGLPEATIKTHTKKLGGIQQITELMWKGHYNVLPRLIKQHELQIGCEVGVAFGGHSEKILQETSIKKLYSVDPYRHFPRALYRDPLNFEQETFDVLHRMVKHRLSTFDSRSELVRAASLEAADTFPNHAFDFVFIDANHSYQATLEDIHAWFPKVRPGGLLVGDDYTYKHPGVIRAVDEFCASKNLVAQHDKMYPRIWWVLK